MKEGDRISYIKKGEEVFEEEDERVGEAISFFTNLLVKDHNLVEQDQMEILSTIPNLIHPKENEMIGAIPSPLEVQQAVFFLAADKSLGPDGFPSFFF